MDLLLEPPENIFTLCSSSLAKVPTNQREILQADRAQIEKPLGRVSGEYFSEYIEEI